jgi:HSP20 family protein
MTRRTNNGPQVPVRSESTGWDPFRIMESMLRWDPLTGSLSSGGSAEVYVPKFDVRETKDSYVFTADLPGIKEDGLDISLTGNRLTVSGKREAEEQTQSDRYHLYERSYGSFSRTFTLPEGIDSEHVNADLKDGVLTLTVAKKPEVQPRRIQVGGRSGTSGGNKGQASA